MAPDPRAAFDRFVAALEAHLEAVVRDRSDDSPAVISATTTLVDAFETYDEALYDRYGVDTPFVVYDDSDEDDEEYDDEDEDAGEDEEDESDEDLESLDDDEPEEVAPAPPVARTQTPPPTQTSPRAQSTSAQSTPNAQTSSPQTSIPPTAPARATRPGSTRTSR